MDIRDLYSVDALAMQHLFNELKNEDYDLMVAHLIGVDHMAHSAYANHPIIRDQLKVTSDMIQRIQDEMKDDTLLIVLSDHGMKDDGNHGGSSKEETDTFLYGFLKSEKKQFFQPKTEEDEYILRKGTVDQIDITPTIAELLGIPIPYSNLGHTLMNFMIDENQTSYEIYQTEQRVLKQIMNYLEIIQKENAFFKHDLFEGWRAKYNFFVGQKED